ncbi:hypothetical protein RB195_020681 [Necator americanus]|uniref:Small nuclear RNA-activating complex polypeptide 3 n=1 Tax=Necator americanus TaxID=51031 RepID=A0ABR1CKU2_NECAM
MDRRLNADFYSFISPVMDLREFLNEAFTSRQNMNDFFLLTGRISNSSSMKPMAKSESQDIDWKRDFATIANCKPWTANKICDGDLQPTRFLAFPDLRSFEELNGLNNIHPTPKLKTLQLALERNGIAKNPQRKSNYLRDLKYDKYDTCEKDLRRSHSSPISLPCARDIVITCTVVVPHNKILSQEETRNTRLLLAERKLMLRGDSTLMSLRQKLLCICDSVVELEDGKELEPIEQEKTHMVLYPSSFIFIHDTFYVDYSIPNSKDISAPIREFMGRKKCFDPVTSRDIEGVRIIDLKLRLGQPYVFQHSGTCEHLLIFHDLRLLERTDVQDLERYPMVIYEKKGDVRCSACKRGYAAFVVEECERLPSPYMMFCEPCFREFFFLHGHKIGRFRAHPYMPINQQRHWKLSGLLASIFDPESFKCYKSRL